MGSFQPVSGYLYSPKVGVLLISYSIVIGRICHTWRFVCKSGA